MTDIVTISDHVARALGRSMEQYKQKDRHEAYISAFSKQVQDAEDAIFDMIDARSLALAVGEQLDGIGQIVGLARQGLNDADYRILLLVKIGQNTSQGGPAKIISIFKLLTQADLVQYMNLTGAAIMLATDAVIATDEIESTYRNMELIAAGGVRIDHIVCFDPTEPFAFSGPNTNAPGEGFSDITGTIGGKFATLHRNKVPFAFAGTTETSRGFGSILDPIAGGTFVGIGG